MKKKILYVLIFFMVLVWGVNAYIYLKPKEPATIYIPGSNESTTTTTAPPNVTLQISKKCSLDSDCSWQSTNCCPENAGANWECINMNKSVMICEGNIFCPQYISTKPNIICKCVQGECSG